MSSLPAHLVLAAGVTSFWRGAWYVIDVAVRPTIPLCFTHLTAGRVGAHSRHVLIARCSPSRCCSPAAQRSRSAGAASQRCTTASRRRSWRGRGPMASAGLRGRRSSTRRGSAWCAPKALRSLSSSGLCPALCETIRGRETNRRARRCEQHSAARGRCAAGVGCGCCGTLCSRQAAARRTAWHRGWPHMAAGWRCSCSAVRRHLPSPSAPQRLGCCSSSSSASSSCGS